MQQEYKQTIKSQLPLDIESEVCLTLANGSRWFINAGNERAYTIVSRLKDVMQLIPMACRAVASHHGLSCRLTIFVDDQKEDFASCEDTTLNLLSTDHPSGFVYASSKVLMPASSAAVPPDQKDTIAWVISAAEDDITLAIQLMRLSWVFCRHTEFSSGLMVHGALAEKDGNGVILAGPGGVGKTTASQQLSPPWRSLCDDTTLIVRDNQGIHWAHPWPTWNKFIFDGSGGQWDVQHAVPLKSIFFLKQASEDKVEPIRIGQATCMLVESAEQASGPMLYGMVKDEKRALRLKRFENICILAKAVPSYLLHLGMRGAFWQKIEQTINNRESS